MPQSNTNLTRNPLYVFGAATTLFFISIFIILFVACKPSSQPTTKNSDKTKRQAKQIANTDFRHDPWQTTNVKLLQTGGQNPIDVSAQTTIYRCGTGNNEIPIDVIAFEIPGANRSWIGPAQDAYVKSGNQVLGARFNAELTLLFWRQSMHQPLQATNLAPTSLSENIAAFDSSIDIETLWDAFARADIEDDHVTDIESKIGRSFFVVGATMGEMEITSIVAGNNSLKFGIKNLTTEATADVWVDVVSREVVKATKNGAQIFPDSENGPETAPTSGDLQNN